MQYFYKHPLQATGLRHAPTRHLGTRVHHQGNCIIATYLEEGWNAQEVGWTRTPPLMTWGEVESTSYRFQDTPLRAISGPGFTIKVFV